MLISVTMLAIMTTECSFYLIETQDSSICLSYCKKGIKIYDKFLCCEPEAVSVRLLSLVWAYHLQ